MTFLAGFTLTVIGAVVGFFTCAILASGAREDEAAHAAHLMGRLRAQLADMEARYLALLEAHLRRENHEGKN